MSEISADNDFNKSEKVEKVRVVTPGQLVLRRFMRNKLAIAGFIMLIVMGLFSFAGPLFSPYGEYEIFYQQNGEKLINPTDEKMREKGVRLYDKTGPSLEHWLGTNENGQDVLIRMMHGGRISMLIGLFCVFIEILIGMTLGGIAGYYGKWVDMLIMRVVDIFYCIPFFPVVLISGVIMNEMKVPQSMRIYALVVIMGLLGWASVARMVRGQILSLREQEYIMAAEATGIRPMKKIFKHLLPNVMPQLIVNATLGIGSVILTEAALSYLGFGVPTPYASWGNMVSSVVDTNILRYNMNIWIPPGVCILITVMAFNFLGDGLRDAFDPKLKR